VQMNDKTNVHTLYVALLDSTAPQNSIKNYLLFSISAQLSKGFTVSSSGSREAYAYTMCVHSLESMCSGTNLASPFR